MLTKDQVLSAADSKVKVEDVPEWGDQIGIKVMSGTERDAWEASAFVDGKLTRDNIRARLLAATLCDANGVLLFTEVDVVALGRKSSAPLTRLFQVAQKLNALSDSDVDELAKNS